MVNKLTYLRHILFKTTSCSSLKTEENLKTVTDIPNDKILIETDCPWCEIRPSHAGYKFISKESQSIASVKKEKWKADCMVKSRNEPVNIW